MIRYVAFLRGINVGGHKKIKMADLRKMLAGLGFKDIKTLLASGNAVFEAPKTDEQTLVENIEEAILQTFGFEVKVILRTFDSLEKWSSMQPFQGVTVDKNTRLYVTMFSESLSTSIEIPYQSPEKSFRILQQTSKELFSVLQLTSKSRTTDAMKIIENEYGKKGTTRNWNTIKKMISLREK